MSKFGAFTEGFLGGLEKGGVARARNEVNREMRDERESREEFKSFSKETSALDPTSFAASPDQTHDVAGPPEPGKAGPQAVSGYDQIQRLQRRAMAHAGTSEQRQAMLDQVDDISVRAATMYIGNAEAMLKKSPETAVNSLNRAAQMLGMPDNAFSVDEKGVVGPEGKAVDSNTFQFLLHYAKDPVLAREWLRESRRQDASDKLEQDKFDLADWSTRQEVERGWASQNFAERLGWTEVSQRWAALGLDKLLRIDSKDQFDQEIRLKREQLKVDTRRSDAMAQYYGTKYATAMLEQEALGRSDPWEGNFGHLLSAIDNMHTQFADEDDLIFSEPYVKNLKVPDGSLPQTPASLKTTAISMAGQAITEQGPRATALAKQGAILTISALNDDFDFEPRDVYRADPPEGDGNFYFEVEGVQYPISFDNSVKLTNAAARNQAIQGARGAGPVAEQAMQREMVEAQGLPVPKRGDWTLEDADKKMRTPLL